MYVSKEVKAIFKSISFYLYDYFVCMHVYEHHMCAELVEAREGARSPWIKVTEDWELPSGHWKLNLNCRQE